jgi:hypothetical protein
MLKLPLILLLALGTSAAQASSQDSPSLAQLQTNTRMLLVFAPSVSSPGFRQQLNLIQRHSFELSSRNTVFVPISTPSKLADEKYNIENLHLDTASEQAAARARFHVQPDDFLVILVDENGTQQIRSAAPVDIRALTASLDAIPARH